MIPPLPPHSVAALLTLADLGPSTRAAIVEATELHSETVHNALRSLRYRGLATSTPRLKGARYIWTLTPYGARVCNRIELRGRP